MGSPLKSKTRSKSRCESTIKGAFTILPKLPFARGFYLRAPNLSESERHAADRTDRRLIGHVAEAITPLRPSGSILLDGVPRDAVTKGIMLARGARVRIVDVSGNRIIVEPIESENHLESKA